MYNLKSQREYPFKIEELNIMFRDVGGYQYHFIVEGIQIHSIRLDGIPEANIKNILHTIAIVYSRALRDGIRLGKRDFSKQLDNLCSFHRKI